MGGRLWVVEIYGGDHEGDGCRRWSVVRSLSLRKLRAELRRKGHNISHRAVYGERTEALMAAVPSAAHWRATSLPTALNEMEIERFLDSFDCANIEGSRNYAIARCLVDLGLRFMRVRLEPTPKR